MIRRLWFTSLSPGPSEGTAAEGPNTGRTWTDTGTIGAGPKELTFSGKGELYASVSGGAIKRSADGGRTWTEVVKVG
jgi:hypothetical protein